MDELKAIIRSLAISSASGMTLSQLDHDFKNLEGYSIPYQTHGFKSLHSMLKTLTDVVRVNGNDQQSTIHPVTTEKNQHIRSLVEKSKKSKKRKIVSHSSRPTSSIPKQPVPKGKPCAYPIQSYITTRNNKSQNNAQWWPSNYSEADYHFEQFLHNLNGMMDGGNGQYNWSGYGCKGASKNGYHRTSKKSYHNNQQYNNQQYGNQQNWQQQYYQHYMQQIAAWNYNYTGWNYNQVAPQQWNMNQYTGNNAYHNGNGCYPPNWRGNNNMFYNNFMGYNNAAGGFHPNQWNYGMGGNFMNYGYNNNYPSYACNYGANNYNMANWYNGYGQYQN
uniref:HTH OST-type domain-containing protein n=1 Tax=Anopheles minimus TaxID=112268 RepID=A0A182W7I3_9DIPT